METTVKKNIITAPVLLQQLKQYVRDPCLALLKGPFHEFRGTAGYASAIAKFKKSPFPQPKNGECSDAEYNYFIEDPNSDGFAAFMEYCKKAACDEGLHWMTYFKKMEESCYSMPGQVMVHFQKAYDIFFSPNGQMQLNLTHFQIGKVRQLYRDCFGAVPPPPLETRKRRDAFSHNASDAMF